MQISLSSPDITELEEQAVLSVLRSSRLSLGPQAEAFEAAVASHVGVSEAIAVSSGTAGLHLCLLALGVGEGNEVLVPSFTFIAAANAIRYVGATPVFVEIDAQTLNLSPSSVEAGITPRTRAIVIVHTFGYPAAMEALMKIARRHGLLIIEDACEALGATYRDQPVGSFGHAAVFAFYPNKQITTGEGGMIVTRDAALARELRALRNQGRYGTDDWYQHSILGYNYRLSELNCALGCAQMSRLPAILSRREQVAARYHEQLAVSTHLKLPLQSTDTLRVSWFVYVVRVAPSTPLSRDALMRGLQAEGIQCGRYFAPIHRQPAYAALCSETSLPITEAESAQTVALPFFTQLQDSAFDYVANKLLSLLHPR